MALDFPSAPSVGQSYQGYTWDGEKWAVAPSGAAMRRYYFVATAGQVTFSGADAAGQTLGYTPGGVEVAVNGIWLPYVDYTATNGTSIVLGAAAAAGDIVYVYALSNFSVLDAVAFNTAQSVTEAQKAQARSNIGLDLQKKNYIINGAMMISQENGTTAVTATGTYPVDEFQLGIGGTTGTVSAAQVASVAPSGSPNRLRVTVTAADAAVAAGDIVQLSAFIEGTRTADLRFGSGSAKTITIRFGVKAPAGTYCVTILNSAVNRSYVAEYVISGGEANTDVVKSVTIAGDQSGTWLTDTGIGLRIYWGLMVGSTFQQAAGSWGTLNARGSANQFNLLGTNGNVFELFDVGLYEGSVVPTFVVPDFISELDLCMRYWEKSFPYATVPAQNAGLAGAFSGPQAAGASVAQIVPFVPYTVLKRATPTITIFNPSAANAQIRNTSASSDWSSTATNVSTERGFTLSGTSPAATGVGQGMALHFTANARM